LREETEQAKTRLCESLGLNPASTWQQVSEELETYVGNALALPNVEHQLEQAQAGVEALRDEVERLRSAVGGEQESAEQQRERAYAAERRAEEAEGRLSVAVGTLRRFGEAQTLPAFWRDEDDACTTCGA